MGRKDEMGPGTGSNDDLSESSGPLGMNELERNR